jgi:hypothetical protein
MRSGAEYRARRFMARANSTPLAVMGACTRARPGDSSKHVYWPSDVGRLAAVALLAVPAFGGTIGGRVVDAEQKPVAGAYVFIFEQETGVPLTKTKERFTDLLLAKEGRVEELWRAKTDGNGGFLFEGVPAGTYRLVAQSWRGGARKDGKPFEVNGGTVDLRGVAANIQVQKGQRADALLKPLGRGVLHLDLDVSNSWSVLVLSLKPARADPVLGFAGWTGSFARNIIGANRMPKGVTTLTGLPGGRVHAVTFGNDNNPAWGAAAFEIADGKRTEGTVEYVGTWSNARHKPPQRLQNLATRLKDTNIYELLKKQHGFRGPGAGGMWKSFADAAALLDKTLVLPDGEKVPCADGLAVFGYQIIGAAAPRRKKPR